MILKSFHLSTIPILLRLVALYSKLCTQFTAMHYFPLQIYWLKDRVEVQPERDPNYLQAADGHLILIQAREGDAANYTCVAENVASRRLSPVARLQVVGKCIR